jgi:signal transduction histidine kinase/DNA-binding response OmpR family regulator/HAMP domain-containing protein
MKINHRIILVNLLIVAIVLGSATIAFYSIMYNSFSAQQSKNIINSTRNFVFTYRSLQDDIDDEFLRLKNKSPQQIFDRSILSSSVNDFFLKASSNNIKEIIDYSAKESVVIPDSTFTIEDFVKSNPYAVIHSHQSGNGELFYFGKIISSEFLNSIAQKIGADIALILDNFTAEVSNASGNTQHLLNLSNAYKSLKQKGDYEVFIGESESSDIIASAYNLEKRSDYGNNLSFLIFKSHSESSDLRQTLTYIIALIGFVGIIIALILSYVLTHNMRLRISELSYATSQTSAGNFNTRITVKGNDEIGNLGKAFNVMLDELQKKQQAVNEYAEFITLINQNATLVEISNTALKKIIDTCGFVIGALYSVDEGELSLISSIGFDSKSIDRSREQNEFYKRVISNKETIELSSDLNLPVIKTGMVDVKLHYLLIHPVIYNNNVTAVLEFASFKEPGKEAKDYLSKIQEQLAIGITNAKAVVQLENFVNELRKLNDEYQKQNIQIKKQNETLLELSSQLKAKAEELSIQKEKAEESTKLKSQFLASMSHELRTPMNSILGLTELILERANLDNRNKERLKVVLNSGRRLMSLINDILDLSKIESGKMEVHDEDVLLEELIEEVSNTINPLALEKGLNFNIRRDCNTRIIINTDRGRVVQVLLNLLGNAVKFTEKGKVELAVSVTSDRMLKFSVSDTGIGISKQNQEAIFEEFRQLDGTTTRKYSGTGLGLAICKKIIDLLGGSIGVDSIEGKGSTFSFTIPIKFLLEKRKSNSLPINLEVLRKNIKNPILVIDDDPEIRYTIGQYLNSNGYEVIFAEDADNGIRLAIEKQPFAITLDILLPDRDGWNVLKELKENSRTKDIPVILVSIIGDRNVGFGLGAFEYFIKPISADKLISAFNKLEMLAKKRIQKIVIVNDDELEFEKFRREFRDENLSIEFIKDSEFAFNKIAEVQPDLIILDLMMPKIDGITLSHKLKSNSATKHIPIIISTAKDLNVDEKESLKAIVEEITIKSKGHPLDVLKIVRDRIKMQEENGIMPSASKNSNLDSSSILLKDPSENYSGQVLIVDDDPDTLFTLNEIVQAAGCKTYMAKSGVECLKLLEQIRPDLIMLDIMMPEMDGFQTLNNIRANRELADIPIFAVTAKAMAGDKEVVLKHGFNDYIPKPVNSTIIFSKIGQLFSKIKTG